MPRPKIDPGLLAKCRIDWEAGVSLRDVAETYGVSLATIRRYRLAQSWSRDLSTISSERLDLARKVVEDRMIKAVEDAGQSMEHVLERHRRTSDRIAEMLEASLTEVDTLRGQGNPSKYLSALKTAAEVSISVQKQERRSWGMDHKEGSSDLEAILDEIEDEEGGRSKPKLTVVGQDK